MLHGMCAYDLLRGWWSWLWSKKNLALKLVKQTAVGSDAVAWRSEERLQRISQNRNPSAAERGKPTR